MKKTALILSLFLGSFSAFAQSKVVKDSSGNYVQISVRKSVSEGKLIGKTFTTSKGEQFPIYVSESGKYYVIRTAKESGNQYKQYLKIEN